MNLLTPYYYSLYSISADSGRFSPYYKHISLKNYFVYLSSENTGASSSPGYHVHFVITNKSSLQIFRSQILFSTTDVTKYNSTYIVAAVPDRDNQLLVMVGGVLQLINISGSTFIRTRTYSGGGTLSSTSYMDVHPIMGKKYFCFRPDTKYSSNYIYGEYDNSTIYTFSRPSGWGFFYGIISDYMIALIGNTGQAAIRLDWLNMKTKQTGTANPIASLPGAPSFYPDHRNVVYDHIQEHIYYIVGNSSGSTYCLTVNSNTSATTKTLSGQIHDPQRDILIDPYTKRISGEYGLMAYDTEPTVNYVYNDAFTGVGLPVGNYFICYNGSVENGVIRNSNGGIVSLIDYIILNAGGAPSSSYWKPAVPNFMPRPMNSGNLTDLYAYVQQGGNVDSYTLTYVKYSLSQQYHSVLA